jgi:hypothetical protein
MAPVPAHVVAKLGLPETLPRLRGIGEGTSGVAMPEASMHKDDRLPFRQNNVGTPRKGPHMEAVPKSHLVEQRAHRQFGARILPLYAGHVPAASRFRQSVSHISAVLGSHEPLMKYLRDHFCNLTSEKRRYCIADLLILGRARPHEEVIVGKGL